MESKFKESVLVSTQQDQKKLFTEKQIGVSALIGGPIPPGILIYINLRRLDKEKAAYITLAGTFIFTMGLVYGLINIPEHIIDKIPSNLFPTIIGVIVWALYRILIARVAREELDAGSPRESNWKVARLTLVGIILHAGVLLSVASVTPYFPGDKLTFDGNEVYYDQSQTSDKDVQVLASQLFNIGYFEEGQNYIAGLETMGDTYIVTLPLRKQAWEDTGIVGSIKNLKDLLQIDYGAKVTIVVEDYDLAGNRLTKIF